MSRLRQNVRSSVAWASAESLVNILAALCTTLVVGRIIGPTEFGLAALAYMLGTLAETFVTTPFVDALIQRRRFTQSLVDGTFTAMIGVGIGVYLLIVIAAPLMARLYNQPALTALLIVQGTTCLFAGVRGVPEAIMARKLRFNQISVRSVIAKIASVLVSLLAALLGMGAWSIILGNVAFAVATTVMVLSMTKRIPKFAVRPGPVASLVSFGMFILLEALLWSATPRLFCFFVGYYQGLQTLGQLTIAFRINDTACSIIHTIASRLALPMLSRVAEDRRRLEQGFLQGTRMVCLIVAPVFLGLAMTSHDIVALVLGPSWPLAAPALVAVSVFSLFIFVRVLAHPTVKAVARPSLLIGPNVIGLIYITAGSLVLRHAGFQGALSVWISFGVVFLICSLRMIQKAIGTGWLRQLVPLGPAVLPSLGMAGVLVGIDFLHPDLSALAMVMLKITLGAASYGALLIALERPLLVELLRRPSMRASGEPQGTPGSPPRRFRLRLPAGAGRPQRWVVRGGPQGD